MIPAAPAFGVQCGASADASARLSLSAPRWMCRPRLFDNASRNETARGFVQDDTSTAVTTARADLWFAIETDGGSFRVRGFL